MLFPTAKCSVCSQSDKGSFTIIDIYESVHSVGGPTLGGGGMGPPYAFPTENQHLFVITDNVL